MITKIRLRLYIKHQDMWVPWHLYLFCVKVHIKHVFKRNKEIDFHKKIIKCIYNIFILFSYYRFKSPFPGGGMPFYKQQTTTNKDYKQNKQNITIGESRNNHLNQVTKIFLKIIYLNSILHLKMNKWNKNKLFLILLF